MRRLIAAALTVLVVATVHGSSGQSSEGIAPLKPTSTSLSVNLTEFTLANGLHVILHRDASVPVISVNVWYHVGSANEKPGRTGFAHLFEHLMFEGSKNVPEGAFDNWLEAAGGSNNGSTTNDRTNYYVDIPSNAPDLALFLESDRMGYLLDTMTPARVDGQRDVVNNERRQSYENQPYGRAFLELAALLYPKNHPYSWPTIGSMEDLTAASRDDVAEFFRNYAPNNASR
jgi:zinc protease